MAENRSNTPRQDEPLQFKDLLIIYISKWKWFVLSLAVCLGIAAIYLLKTPPVYTRTASLLIEEDKKGQSIASEMNFSDLGLFQSNTNVNNEIIALSSPATMQEVVRRLSLDVSYSFDGKFHRETAYGTSLPITASFADLPDNATAEFSLRIVGEDSLVMEEFKLKGDKVGGKKAVSGKLNTPVKTPVGTVTITPTPFFTSEYGKTIYISRNSLYGATNSCSSRLSVTLANKEATVINLSYDDVSVERARCTTRTGSRTRTR